jgi:hypothetical protein
VKYSSESDTFPHGAKMSKTHGTSGYFITYTFTIGSDWAAQSDGSVAAKWSGSGSTHSFSDDTYSVVSTSGGQVSTVSGSF